MLNEMEVLSNRELTDRAEAWLAFESRILQTLSRDENGDHIYPCAADHLLEIAEMIDGAESSIGLIEASLMPPRPPFRPV
jgi:hypothetical protein